MNKNKQKLWGFVHAPLACLIVEDECVERVQLVPPTSIVRNYALLEVEQQMPSHCCGTKQHSNFTNKSELMLNYTKRRAEVI